MKLIINLFVLILLAGCASNKLEYRITLLEMRIENHETLMTKDFTPEEKKALLIRMDKLNEDRMLNWRRK